MGFSLSCVDIASGLCSHKTSNGYCHVQYNTLYKLIVLKVSVDLFVLQMVTSNIIYYNTLLQCGKVLFKVESLLLAPEIVIHPHANELFKLMVNVVRDIVEG